MPPGPFCTSPGVASSGMLAPRRSLIASPSASRTCGLFVSSVFGVFTGSFASKACAHGEGSAPDAWSQKRRNSTAPFELRFSCRSQRASTSHAFPTWTGGPDEVGASPPGIERHIRTSESRVSSPAY
jgi:hypothetical protein